MIRYSKATLQGSGSQYARGMEETIGTNLEALQKKIADAAAAMGKATKQDALSRAADKARDLTRGLESIDQRMRDRSQNGRNQQGQQGRDQQQNGQQGSQNGQASSQNGQGSSQNGQASSQSGRQGGQNGQNADGSQNGGGAHHRDANGSPKRGGGYWGRDARNWGAYRTAGQRRPWRR